MQVRPTSGGRHASALDPGSREVRMRQRAMSRAVVMFAASTLLAASAAWATTSTVGDLQPVSGVSPFAGCTADDVASQSGKVFPNSEVEPWIAASGRDLNGDGAADIIAGYQQDRWSNGGSRGIYSSAWFNGAWVQVAVPGTSVCVGGTHLRATDP